MRPSNRVIPLTAVAAVVLTLASVSGAGALAATVVDREGTRHDVEELEIRGNKILEYYADGRRRQTELARIERIEFGGSAQDQQVEVTVTLRTGRVERGEIIVDGRVSPHSDVVSGGLAASDRLTGRTELGPLFLPLSQVSEVRLQHDSDLPVVSEIVDATIVTEAGRRLEVTDLRFRGDDDFRYQQGRKRRRVKLRHLERLEFSGAPGNELRTVTLTYRSGRVLQGQVDASTVRLPGETDHVYWTRVGSAFTGRQPAGRRGVGLDEVKLVIIRPEDEGEDQDEDAGGTAAQADSAAAQ